MKNECELDRGDREVKVRTRPVPFNGCIVAHLSKCECGLSMRSLLVIMLQTHVTIFLCKGSIIEPLRWSFERVCCHLQLHGLKDKGYYAFLK